MVYDIDPVIYVAMQVERSLSNEDEEELFRYDGYVSIDDSYLYARMCYAA